MTTTEAKTIREFITERGEITVSEPARSWREQDGIIYFSVTSDGTEGETWIERLEDEGCRVSDYAKQVLCSPDFKPTSGVTTEVAVLKGMLFEDNGRFTKSIRAYAHEHKLIDPNAEIACLIREKFTDEEIEAMGLRHIIEVHKPISSGGPYLMIEFRSAGFRTLSAAYDRPGDRWNRNIGFAFALTGQGRVANRWCSEQKRKRSSIWSWLIPGLATEGPSTRKGQ